MSRHTFTPQLRSATAPIPINLPSDQQPTAAAMPDHRAVIEQQARIAFLNGNGVLWELVVSKLQDFLVHPMDMTEREFVDFVLHPNVPAWLDANLETLAHRALSRRMQLHLRMAQIGISPRLASALDMRGVASDRDRVSFINEYHAKHAINALRGLGIRGVTNDEAEKFARMNMTDQNRFVLNRMSNAHPHPTEGNGTTDAGPSTTAGLSTTAGPSTTTGSSITAGPSTTASPATTASQGEVRHNSARRSETPTLKSCLRKGSAYDEPSAQQVSTAPARPRRNVTWNYEVTAVAHPRDAARAAKLALKEAAKAARLARENSRKSSESLEKPSVFAAIVVAFRSDPPERVHHVVERPRVKRPLGRSIVKTYSAAWAAFKEPQRLGPVPTERCGD